MCLIDVRKGKVLRKIRFRCEVNEMAWHPSGELLLLTTGHKAAVVDEGIVEVMRLKNNALESVHKVCACPRPRSSRCERAQRRLPAVWLTRTDVGHHRSRHTRPTRTASSSTGVASAYPRESHPHSHPRSRAAPSLSAGVGGC